MPHYWDGDDDRDFGRLGVDDDDGVDMERDVTAQEFREAVKWTDVEYLHRLFLAAAEQREALDAALAQLAVLRPGGTYAWKYRAESAEAELSRLREEHEALKTEYRFECGKYEACYNELTRVQNERDLFKRSVEVMTNDEQQEELVARLRRETDEWAKSEIALRVDILALQKQIATLTTEHEALLVDRNQLLAEHVALKAQHNSVAYAECLERIEGVTRRAETAERLRDEAHSWVMRWQNHLACNGFQDAIEELGMVLTLPGPPEGPS